MKPRLERQLLAQHAARGEAFERDLHAIAATAHDALVRTVVVRDRDLIETRERGRGTGGATPERGEHDVGHLERTDRQGADERLRGRRWDHFGYHHPGPFAEAVPRDRRGRDATA